MRSSVLNNINGKFLIGNLGKENFLRPVIWVLEYSANGGYGFVLNQPLGAFTFSEILRRCNKNSPVEYDSTTQLISGGSENKSSIFIIHSEFDSYQFSYEYNEEKIFISNEVDIIYSIGRGLGPKKWKVFAGLTKWQPGELELEVASSNWLIISAPVMETICSSSPAEDLWSLLINTAKVNPIAYSEGMTKC